MTAFNVLDRKESVHRNLLLEASAGTGKTFAIENIVVRLLIGSNETEPLLIENILVVTFTRMAVRELKERIRANLDRCQKHLKRFLCHGEVEGQMPDYLCAVIESGEEEALKAKRSIEQALFSFDRAQIFTIHGFCWRMLRTYSIEAGMSLDSSSSEDQTLSMSERMNIVRDFLRSELDPVIYSQGQLKILSKKYERDPDKLQRDLLSQIDRGMEIKPSPPFVEAVSQFSSVMRKLKEEHRWEGKKILEDCLALAPSYKDLCDNKGRIKKIVQMERFAALFDQEDWAAADLDVLVEDGLILLEAFDPGKLKVKAKSITSMHYPNLLVTIKEQLEEVVLEARNEAAIFSRFAYECQRFVRAYQEQEEMFGHNDLLVQMKKAIEGSSFVACIRSQYQAAIIDEFQDTDPLQWEIFSSLFATPVELWNGYLALVGDPKQSIYAFRQADIYTYLRAAEKLGPGTLATLDTNFRSQPFLIEALNRLFSSAKEVFSLPKLSHFLPYRTVSAGRKENSIANIAQSSMEFWEVSNEGKTKNSLRQVEAEIILPSIANEIAQLHENECVGFSQCAILIADRYQEQRVSEYLRACDIPVKNQRGIDISRSTVAEEMRDLLKGVLNYHSRSDLSVALAGRLVGMDHSALYLLEDEKRLFVVVEQFSRLKKVLTQFGFAKFFHQFMECSCHSDGKSILEQLLGHSDGLEFYRVWQDLADLLIAEEQTKNLSPYDLIAFLDQLDELSDNQDERIKAYVDPDEEGVAILTTHASKGLEFDIVFALGPVNRVKSPEQLIPMESENGWFLGAVKNESDPRYLKFCEENDAEKMRQLYVAFTRAREKLYVPVVLETHSKAIPFGTASPIELFLAKLNQESDTDYEGLYKHIAVQNGSCLRRLVAEHPETMRLKKLYADAKDTFSTKHKQPPVLLEPKPIIIPGNPCVIQSFTSLTQNHCGGSIFGNDLMAPHDFAILEKTEYTLPSGNETGVLLHKIFEMLSFDSVLNLTHVDQVRPLIIPFLKGTSFHAWEEVIAKIVFNTLKTPIGVSDPFCLAQIDPKKIYREMDFLYPCNQEQTSGFLKGVVDLFFEYRGRYFLLDWKSNWLGPSQEYYQRANLEEAMRANSYGLQAQIYAEAFRKYLGIFDKRPFEEIFGGIYYLFVRGISGTTGVLHLPYSSLELK